MYHNDVPNAALQIRHCEQLLSQLIQQTQQSTQKYQQEAVYSLWKNEAPSPTETCNSRPQAVVGRIGGISAIIMGLTFRVLCFIRPRLAHDEETRVWGFRVFGPGV